MVSTDAWIGIGSLVVGSGLLGMLQRAISKLAVVQNDVTWIKDTLENHITDERAHVNPSNMRRR